MKERKERKKKKLQRKRASLTKERKKERMKERKNERKKASYTILAFFLSFSFFLSYLTLLASVLSFFLSGNSGFLASFSVPCLTTLFFQLTCAEGSRGAVVITHRPSSSSLSSSSSVCPSVHNFFKQHLFLNH